MSRWLVVCLLIFLPFSLYSEEISPASDNTQSPSGEDQPVVKPFFAEKKTQSTLVRGIEKRFQSLLDEVEASELAKSGYEIRNIKIDRTEVTIILVKKDHVFQTLHLTHPLEDCAGEKTAAFCVTEEKSVEKPAIENDPLEKQVRRWLGALESKDVWQESGQRDALRSMPPPDQQLPVLGITDKEMERLYQQHPDITPEKLEQKGQFSPVPDRLPELDTHYAELGAKDRPRVWKQFLQAAMLPILLFLYVIFKRHGRSVLNALKRPRIPRSWLPEKTRNRWILFGILLFGADIRALNLSGMAMQIDEWSNVEFLPLLDVAFHGYETLTNPPLLYVIQHFLYPISTHPAWIRLPVFLFGVVLIWAVWRAGKTLFDERTALVAAILAALHPALTVFSQTIRAYEPAACILMLALPHVWRMSRRKESETDAIAFGLLSSLALWMHYPSLLLLGPMFIWVAFGVRRDRKRLKQLMFVAIWVTATFIPLMPFFFAYSGKQGAGFFPYYFSQSFDFITGMPFKTGILALLAMFVARSWKQAGWRWLAGLSAATVFFYILGSCQIMHVPHYTVMLIPLFLLLLAASLTDLGNHVRRIALAIVLFAMAAVQIALLLMPSENLLLSQMAYVPMQRGMSHEVFAQILEKADQEGEKAQCHQLVTAPNYDKETYLYHFGRKTLHDVGVQPFVEHSEARFEVNLGEKNLPWTLSGIVLLGPYKGRKLQERLEEDGCFWYSRMHQNCTHQSGVLYDPVECDWLAHHCTKMSSMAMDELYRCEKP